MSVSGEMPTKLRRQARLYRVRYVVGALALAVAVYGVLVGVRTLAWTQHPTPAKTPTLPSEPAGTLDSSFGGDGIVTDLPGGPPSSVAVQSDGKIVVAGGDGMFALVRYEPDGTLDSTFGETGLVTTDITSDGHEFASQVVIQDDGKILVAGFSGTGGFALLRYNADGTPDGGLGKDGRVVTEFDTLDDVAYAIAIQTDGKIVLAGEAGSRPNHNDGQFGLARYESDGTLDPTFGAGGRVSTDLGPGGETAYALAVQPDGGIVAAGLSNNRDSMPPFQEFTLVRYTPDGGLDTTFGENGQVRTEFSKGDDSAFGVAIQTDGRIVAVGSTGFTTVGQEDNDFALARYNQDGTIDPTFGDEGKLETHLGQGANAAKGVAIQADGKIVVAGWSTGGGDIVVARHEVNGSLDPTFGDGGTVLIPIGMQQGWVIHPAVFQADGKIVAIGSRGLARLFAG
jgi:uncharacterized delta-60 repeat protein